MWLLIVNHAFPNEETEAELGLSSQKPVLSY